MITTRIWTGVKLQGLQQVDCIHPPQTVLALSLSRLEGGCSHHSKGLLMMQLAPQGAAAGEPRRRPRFWAAACSLGPQLGSLGGV